MPKTKRDKMKRLLAQAYINTEFSAEYIAALSLEFTGHPSGLEHMLDNVVQSNLMMLDVYKKFAKEAWDLDDPNWYAMAGQNRPSHDLEED